MTRIARPQLFVTLLGVLAVALSVATAGASEERRLVGEYDSGFHDGLAPLEAIFTPKGEERWDVDFHFSHGGRDLTYSGTAKGSLGQGRLSGTVRGSGRTFTFRGEFEDGQFIGTHGEVRRGGERKTGGLRMWAGDG